MKTKPCRDCHAEKPVTDYYSHPCTADRLLAQCKECHKSAVRKNRKKKVLYYRTYDILRYSADPERRAAARRTAKRCPSSKHRSAHKAVHRAILRGALIRQPCEVCGRKDTHGHHDDYSKPLDVRWLCPPHHHEVHGGKNY